MFHRFYEGHYIYEFNETLLNKIPLFKKIGLREIAGAGFLIASEKDLRYEKYLQEWKEFLIILLIN